MERNRTPNPEFVEWMKRRIKLAGEELIKRADLFTLDGLDAMVSLDVHISIPTLAEIDRWPSLTITANCGDATFEDAVMSGQIDPYPPEQFVGLDAEIEKEFTDNDNQENDKQ